VCQETHNFTIGHHEFGNQINVPVTIASQGLWCLLSGSELVVKLKNMDKNNVYKMKFLQNLLVSS
jgi:hypothetical protein